MTNERDRYAHAVESQKTALLDCADWIESNYPKPMEGMLAAMHLRLNADNLKTEPPRAPGQSARFNHDLARFHYLAQRRSGCTHADALTHLEDMTDANGWAFNVSRVALDRLLTPLDKLLTELETKDKK